MSTVLLLSNGHGEDLSGALLARELRTRGVPTEALPLVGSGHPYRQAGIPLITRTREFSTGGIGYTGLRGRLTELREGQALYLLAQLRQLLIHRRRYRLVVAVGDVVPVLAAWLAGLPTAVYLVAYSSHYEGKLRLPWPCGRLLRSRRFRAVWSRDALTAADLGRQLRRGVHFLGNPFLDPVALPGPGGPPLPPGGVLLLPGSRLPEAQHNLERLLRVLELLPPLLPEPGALTLRAALVQELQPAALAALAAPLGWELRSTGGKGPGVAPLALLRGGLHLDLHWGRFADLLGSSDLVVAMAGTAAEQAVGLGRPVLQVAGDGPQFTPAFAEAQRRLLGAGVHCAEGPAGAPATLAVTARLLAGALQRLADPVEGPAWRSDLGRIGTERIGAPGGTGRLATAIMDLLAESPR